MRTCVLSLEWSLLTRLSTSSSSFLFQLYLMSIPAPDEISIEDPLCDSSLGSMVTLDYVTPLTPNGSTSRNSPCHVSGRRFCRDFQQDVTSVVTSTGSLLAYNDSRMKRQVLRESFRLHKTVDSDRHTSQEFSCSLLTCIVSSSWHPRFLLCHRTWHRLSSAATAR